MWIAAVIGSFAASWTTCMYLVNLVDAAGQDRARMLSFQRLPEVSSVLGAEDWSRAAGRRRRRARAGAGECLLSPVTKLGSQVKAWDADKQAQEASCRDVSSFGLQENALEDLGGKLRRWATG
jgi:hypothetical protein